MAAVESGYLKSQLVASHAERRARIESGEEKIVGVNSFESTEPNPLTADLDTAIQTVDPAVEARVVAALRPLARDPRPAAVRPRAPRQGAGAAEGGGGGHRANLMEATLECARAGVTTGEWAGALREVFGEFRAPTGVSSRARRGHRRGGLRRSPTSAARWSGRPTNWASASCGLLVGKPGLDGHSNGAEQIAVRARDAGLRGGLPGHPAHARADRRRGRRRGRARVGLSILSGSHAELVPGRADTAARGRCAPTSR